MDLFDESDSRKPPFTHPATEGFHSEWSDRNQGWNIEVPHGRLFYAERFFPEDVSDRFLDFVQSSERGNASDSRSGIEDVITNPPAMNIRWKQQSLKMFGRQIDLPRLTAWYGDVGASYSYSGIESEPEPWNDALLYLKRKIESCTENSFNSVLLNWYRDGEDHLSWHSDDEPELGKNPVIASASFGAPRDFLLRRINNRKQKLIIPLVHGSLLVMSGALQHHWEHSIPKRKRIDSPRFNLTFRNVYQS